MLLIPKLAEWLRPVGRTAVIHWMRDDGQSGQAFVEGYRVALHGELAAIHDSPLVGISGFTEAGGPRPAFRTGSVERVKVMRRHVAMMNDYLGTQP